MQDAGFRKKQLHSQAPPQLAVALMQPKIWGDVVTKNLGRQYEKLGRSLGMRHGDETWE